jgi:sugar-specific transcriptional regulator TrmB
MARKSLAFRKNLKVNKLKRIWGRMMLQHEDIHTLTGLGLTSLQAKVYLTLVKMGNSTVRNIAEATGLARQEVQRVTAELQTIGLVEKVLTNPTEFYPIAIKDALSFLLERREKEYHDLEQNANRLLKNFEYSPSEMLREDETRFVITTGKEAIIKKSRAIVDRTMESCDIINGYWKNIDCTGSLYKEQNIQALKRHVRIRIVAESLPDDRYVQEIYEHSIENPLFEIRFVPNPLPAIMGIYDKRELLVCTSPRKLVGHSPMLWTNNSALIEAVQTYFEKLWKQSRAPNIPRKKITHLI